MNTTNEGKEPLPENMAEEALEEVRGWKRGKAFAGRVHYAPQSAADILALRQRLGLTQEAFASRFGLSVHTLITWEQGRREPEGAAKTLLKLIATDPETIGRLLAQAG